MKHLIYMVLIIVTGLPGYAQFKYEKEVRLKTRDVMPTAISYVDSFHFNRKVRWYKEYGLDKISIEAKTKYQGSRYSIKFHEDGTLEDLEIEIHPKEIQATIKDTMNQFLQTKHDCYELKKIQIQYVGSRENIWAFLHDKAPAIQPEINYEIVLYVKENKDYKVYEYLFSETGQYRHSVEIIQKNLDHLEY